MSFALTAPSHVLLCCAPSSLCSVFTGYSGGQPLALRVWLSSNTQMQQQESALTKMSLRAGEPGSKQQEQQLLDNISYTGSMRGYRSAFQASAAMQYSSPASRFHRPMMQSCASLEQAASTKASVVASSTGISRGAAAIVIAAVIMAGRCSCRPARSSCRPASTLTRCSSLLPDHTTSRANTAPIKFASRMLTAMPMMGAPAQLPLLLLVLQLLLAPLLVV